jgi:hypothetical protein
MTATLCRPPAETFFCTSADFAALIAVMSDLNQIRKAQTGEPTTNGGHFGSVVRDEAAIKLLAEASYREYVADTVEDRLDALGVDLDDVASVSANRGAFTLALRQPHKRGGWSKVVDVDGGPLIYERDGKRHNTRDYAYEGRDTESGGPYEVWIDGVEYPDPDPEIGGTFRGRDEEGTLTWSSGNYEVTVEADGTKRWLRDGDRHREGGPAVVHANGELQWFLNDREVRAPLPAEPAVVQHGDAGRGHTVHTGSKFVEGTDQKVVAAAIAADIKHAQDLGYLPRQTEMKVTRRTRDNHNSVTVTIEGGTGLLNPDWSEPGQRWYTPEGERVRDALTLIGDSYNRWEEGASSNSRALEYQLTTNFRR